MQQQISIIAVARPGPLLQTEPIRLTPEGIFPRHQAASQPGICRTTHPVSDCGTTRLVHLTASACPVQPARADYDNRNVELTHIATGYMSRSQSIGVEISMFVFDSLPLQS